MVNLHISNFSYTSDPPSSTPGERFLSEREGLLVFSTDVVLSPFNLSPFMKDYPPVSVVVTGRYLKKVEGVTYKIWTI